MARCHRYHSGMPPSRGPTTTQAAGSSKLAASGSSRRRAAATASGARRAAASQGPRRADRPAPPAFQARRRWRAASGGAAGQEAGDRVKKLARGRRGRAAGPRQPVLRDRPSRRDRRPCQAEASRPQVLLAPSPAGPLCAVQDSRSSASAGGVRGSTQGKRLGGMGHPAQRSAAPPSVASRVGEEQPPPCSLRPASQAGAVSTGQARRACTDRFFQAPAGARKRSRTSQQRQPTGPMLAAQQHFPLPGLCLGGDPTKFTCGTRERENTVEVLGRQDWEGWRHSQQRRESSRGVSGQRGPHEQRQAENRGGKHGNTGSREGVQRCWVGSMRRGSRQPLHLLLASRASGAAAKSSRCCREAPSRPVSGRSCCFTSAARSRR